MGLAWREGGDVRCNRWKGGGVEFCELIECGYTSCDLASTFIHY